MKKLFVSAIALFLIFSVQASAQLKWGFIGGMNFNTAKIENVDVKASAGWNAGMTLFLDLPLGLSLQPSLVYSQKNVSVVDNVAKNIGAIELPVSVQWGPDLIAFRPFIDVTPYVGYAITNETTFKGAINDVTGTIGKENADFSRFQYGLGIGAGINVWKLQVIARYVWNFGELSADNFNWDHIVDGVTNDFKNGGQSENFGGITFGVALLF